MPFSHTNRCIYCHLGTVGEAWKLPPEAEESCKLPVNTCHVQGILKRTSKPAPNAYRTSQARPHLLCWGTYVVVFLCVYMHTTCTQACLSPTVKGDKHLFVYLQLHVHAASITQTHQPSASSKVPAESRTRLSPDCCTTHTFCKPGAFPWQLIHCCFKVT